MVHGRLEMIDEELLNIYKEFIAQGGEYATKEEFESAWAEYRDARS